ncbi:MAG: SPOR domain-containing protein [Pseudomonadota bacterium]
MVNRSRKPGGDGQERKSVQRRVFAPFGDNWLAHGAMVGVIILSVLLLLDVSQSPEYYVPAQDPDEQTRERLKRVPAPAAEEPASLASEVPARPYYLQVASFRDKERADELKSKLAELGFKCEVEEVRVNNTEVDYRVRVGPFAGLEALEKSRRKLDDLGIATRTVTNRE